MEHVACIDMKRIRSFICGRELKKGLKVIRVGKKGMDWIHVSQDSCDYQVVVNMAMNIVHFPLNYIIFKNNQYQFVLLYYLFVG